MGLSSILAAIDPRLGDSCYSRGRNCALWTQPPLLTMILVCFNLPSSLETTSTSFSDTPIGFHCSDTGYIIADSAGGPAGRSRFAQSPAAIAILKSMLKEQKLAEVQKPSPPSIFTKECGCQHDWMNAFCLRADKYRAMDPVQAPTVCICRRRDEQEKTCSQFLARCFPPTTRSKSPSSHSRPSEGLTGSCSCCFNQPDNYCTQLECSRMHPDFGHTNHTSCVCYNQADYPHHICASSSSPDQLSIQQWSDGVTPIEGVIAVTSKPFGPASSSARSKALNESWLTQRMTFLGGAALLAFSFMLFCGGILLTKYNKERRKKTNLEQEAHLEESNELNHLNENKSEEEEDHFSHS